MLQESFNINIYNQFLDYEITIVNSHTYTQGQVSSLDMNQLRPQNTKQFVWQKAFINIIFSKRTITFFLINTYQERKKIIN